MKTVITDAGITSIINASEQGPKVNITGVKIGSTIIQPLSTMTDVTNEVWSGGTSFISYHIVDANTFLFRVTLDESIGDFSIGNIGLFTEDGTMFTITTLLGVEQKEKTSSTSAGNRRIYEILVSISGVTELINVSILNASSANLPTIETENDLPSAVTATFDCYLIKYHTKFKHPCLAIVNDTEWSYIDVDAKQELFTPEIAQFDTSAAEGKPVYFDSASGMYKLASTSYLGIRTNINEIKSEGFCVFENANFTVGAYYYVNPNSPGELTSIMNNNCVGLAVTPTTLLLGTNRENKNLKVSSIDPTNPSAFKYPSEQAVVNYLTNSLPMSNDAGAELSWNTNGSSGSSNLIARADHTHTIKGRSYTATCSTDSQTAAKLATVVLPSNDATFTLEDGVRVIVLFGSINSAPNPTLNVNGTGAKPIYVGQFPAEYGAWTAGDWIEFTYNQSGNRWVAINWPWVRRYTYGQTYSLKDTTGIVKQGGIVYVTGQIQITYPFAFGSTICSVTTSPVTCTTGDSNYITLPISGTVGLSSMQVRYIDSDSTAARSGDISWEVTGY